MGFDKLIITINEAFFRLESYMAGRLAEYEYFGFDRAFTELFKEAKRPENFTYENCTLIDKYWELTEQIRVDFDQSDFDNTDAYYNEMFCKDCEEICFVNWDRIEEFAAFTPQDRIDEFERKASIVDIINSTKALHTPAQRQTDKLKSELMKYNFLELESISVLSEGGQKELIELMVSNGMPYAIAMFDYIGFIAYLEKEYFPQKYKLHQAISSWFDLDASGRTVKGNISSLQPNTTENKERYTAHLHKKAVQKDYQNLK